MSGSEIKTAGFDQFFTEICGKDAPHTWQRELATPTNCGNRLIRIPTGFGKTLGVLAAWAWHRIKEGSDAWPRRLVWCVPMRVLVEQTESEVRAVLESLGVLWDGNGTHDAKVGVHLLMGGANAGQWHLYPESDAVLIGTQDMLLSRAMNRGYACPRARWPMEFGLLNQDALWVMDEVQLMDVGLATSGQLQAFRAEDREAGKMLRPCFTWWMSATLQPDWLKKSPDTVDLTEELARNTHRISAESRTGHLWDDVKKTLEVVPFTSAKELARKVSECHGERGSGAAGPTLVVLNTVKRAVEVWKALQTEMALAKVEIRLTHSRFRPAERKAWREDFLNRDACAPGTNRIIVTTQVVEAGVDISAALLITELAPWASLVQRFGRCARWGGEAQVMVADFGHDSDGKAAPYTLQELDTARAACEQLQELAPNHLERFEEENSERLPGLYPYEPAHLLLRHEIDELFDTTQDLSGADIDISRFIRSGNERDIQVFWAYVDDVGPSAELKPVREELCSVPFLDARNWLCGPGKSPNLKSGVRAWVWDWLNREWRTLKRTDIYPGQTVLVESSVGGYRPLQGWDPNSSEPVEPVGLEDKTGDHYSDRECWKKDGYGWRTDQRRIRSLPPDDHADAAEDDESLSIITDGWQTIASHGLQVGRTVEQIAAQVAPEHTKLLHLSGRWHDLGKAHPAFQGSMQAADRPAREDIAKAPDRAWPCRLHDMYRIDSTNQRRGFRHELASTLGLFGVLQRHDSEHPALLGPWREWFDAMGETGAGPAYSSRDTAASTAEPTVIEREILNLTAEQFDLLAYLVCAHHGKVRMSWHASSADQKAEDRRLRIRGVRAGDLLPPLQLTDAEGEFHLLPATDLDLSPAETGLSSRTGKSWTERVLHLLESFGPFTLAWLETLLRAADQRASFRPLADPLLEEPDYAEIDLEGSHRALAQSAGGGASAPPPGGDSPARRQLNGDGGRTGGRGRDSGTTHPPYSGTRYLNTALGILSFREFAPHLAERVADTELSISERNFAQLPVDELLLELHRCICADLTPDIAGRWRLRDVRVGEHQAAPHWQVPMLMHNYAADLEVRLNNVSGEPGDRLIEDLTFAEGRLLYVHPFEDFNGRVTRLFLIELLYRMELPVIDPAFSTVEDTQHYFSALRAYDRRDPGPLSAIWRRRLAEASSS